jgi:hypothetical protein
MAFNFTDERIAAGDLFDVLEESPRGVWIEFEGQRVFLTNIAEPFDYRVYDHAARQADFVNHRAILAPRSHRGNEVDSHPALNSQLKTLSTLPCGCRKIGVLQECPLHDREPSPFNVHPNGRPL